MYRYQPYSSRELNFPGRRARAAIQPPHDGDDTEMSKHFHELRKINVHEGRLCTFDHDTGKYVEVPRPQRVTRHGCVDIAASGFYKIWRKFKSPFHCPHRRRSGLPYEPLVLVLNTAYEGGVADLFKAIDHECFFHVVIPPLFNRRTLVTWQDREAYLAEQEQEEDEDEDDAPGPTSSQQSSSSTSSSSSSASTSSTSSLSSQTSVSSTNSAIAQLTVQAILTPHARYGRPVIYEPSPVYPTPTPLTEARVIKSFYKKSVAEARKAPDVDTMEFLHQIEVSGILADDPSTHPAWDATCPPASLQVYDKRIYPHCLKRTNAFVQFLYKPLGQLIYDLNAVGIPYADYAHLIHATQSCVCCGNHFTPDGYDAHRLEGRCTNHPDLAPIDDCESFDEVVRFRSYRDNKHPHFPATIDQPVAAALMEWNSRLGVPADVWMMAATAVFHCRACDLVRSFPAHLLHLNVLGDCGDHGQALVAPPAED
ncbi:hypothetical protein C8R43DRAFT_1123503 [Mycena crocata]|nr:hypothetical protein C8R43DRAFT_1123503 [Mycena crocata]